VAADCGRGRIFLIFIIFLLFLLLLNNHSHSTIKHSFILHHSPSCLLESSSLLRSAREEPPWGAEPRIELGPALQQADALYQLSFAAPQLHNVACAKTLRQPIGNKNANPKVFKMRIAQGLWFVITQKKLLEL
jgi:hypothetical protein